MVLTNEQVEQIINQEQIAENIQTGASNLGYLSNDYFLYQESSKLALWQSEFSTLSTDLSNLNPTSPEQQTIVNNVQTDLQLLNTVFNSSVSFLQNAPRNVSVRVLPEFQTAWSGLALQNQALALDASVLSESFDNQGNQLKQTNSILIFALLGAFGAYFVTVYFIVYRRTLRSISKLQEGTRIVGSGNLDYSIASMGNDEVGELSQAFNHMTFNLKTVTASKTELEQEIIGRKYAEASLKESEQRWVTTLASIGDAVIATDMEGRIMFMNGVAEELTGWTLIEASQKPVKQIFNIVNEQTRKEVEDPVAKVLESGVVCGLANHTVLVRKDKTEVAIDDSGAPIIDKDGKITGVVLIFRDITERKKAEDDRAKAQVKLEENAILLEEYANQMEDLAEQRAQQLKDAERLAAIGQTAGMVGHDIRNPLQAITGDLYLLGEELKTMPKSEGRKAMEESIEAIDENIVYINKIVSDLQDYTRPLKPNIEAVNLKDLINSTLIVTNIPENIHAEVNAKANLILKVDAAYLRRVLTNLIVNAVQAMPKGGKLTINVVSKKDRAIVSVEDTGVGVPEEVKPNLFKPLFTTKSKGQGLGLAVVKRFVEGLNGKVSFESEEGTGTKFIIDLPLSNKDACS